VRISLRYKAALLIALTELALLGLLLASNLYQTREDLEAELANHARATAEVIAASATEPLLAYDLGQLNNLVHGLVGKHRVVYAEIADHRAQALAHSGTRGEPGNTVTAEQPIRVAGTLFGAVRLELSRAETEAALAQTTRNNLAIVGFEMLLVAAISITLGWFLTRGLDELTRGAEAIGRGDFSARVRVGSRDELGELAARFNDMAGQLDRSHEEIERSHRRFRDMADNVADWLWETDAEGRYTYTSHKVTNLLGYRPEQVIGARAFELMVPEDSERLERLFQQVREVRQPFYGFEYRARDMHGTLVTLETNGSPIFAPDGALLGYRGVTRDISRRKEDEHRLLYLAEHDALTGLASRQNFLDLLDDEIRLATSSKLSLALLFVDLDDFKLINDTHGHLAGDGLLRVVADILRANAGDGCPVARLGGDEFGVVLRGGDAAYAARLGQRLLEAIGTAPLAVGSSAVRLTASIGIAIHPEGGTSAETLLAHADIAMSHAKSQGHHRCHVYQAADGDLESMRHTVNWQTVLHEALAEDRLLLEFQPLRRVSAPDETRMFEALVRVSDRDGDLHSAVRFIDTAEYTGQIAEIDKRVLAHILKVLADPRTRDCRIAMNVSGRSLGTPGFTEHFARELAAHRVDPKHLVFELTETAAIAEMARARNFIGDMKRHGYRFALDDFGVGFSSFSYLKHLPVDMLKIDGAFVRHLDRNREDQIFVRAIVQVARELGIETVAEFVESREVFDLLTDIGVDYVQGFFIGTPGPILSPPAVADDTASAYKPTVVAHPSARRKGKST
jgi:diguanylate cyclase (GGDEF)-like protein/PAS domain S-box-containing protein